MSGHIVSRRRFLANASGSAVGLGLTAAVVRGAPGANERISIGMIGCGDRGRNHLGSIAKFASKYNAQIGAVCDVWKVNLDSTAQKVAEAFEQEPKKYTRFGELLENKDVDAVTIGTPDFSHGPILVAALKAGKDVYVEKPMTIQLSYANQALDLARKNKCIVQCGTQYRSHPYVLGVAKEVATGNLGKITRVTSAASFNQARWKRAHDNCKSQDVDWEAYLLDLPSRPFNPSLLREWHLHAETSNGLPGLWMTHYVDAMALIMDAKYPKTVVANGGNYIWKDGREHADTFSTSMEYPEEFLFDWAMSLGTNADWRFRICGQKGTVEVSGNRSIGDRNWQFSQNGISRGSAQDARKIEPVAANDHMENWLECMRSRELPRADIQFGHQHAVASIMSAMALASGKRQQYDPQTRVIS